MNPQSPYPAWVVLEIQSSGPETGATLSTMYYYYDMALSAYFEKCAAAAQSTLVYHAVLLIPCTPPYNRQLERWEVFDRRGEVNG